ncbi:MAG: tetratricopeptide repeat protein [Terracidiphilus sp.]
MLALVQVQVQALALALVQAQVVVRVVRVVRVVSNATKEFVTIRGGNVRLLSMIALITLLGWSVALPSQSRDEDWKRCRGDDPDLSIGGCSALIQSGQEAGIDLAKAFYDRGSAYMHKGDNDRAIQDYDQALRLNPSDAKAFSNRGLSYAHKGDYDRAIQDYDQALRLNPSDVVAFVGRGNAYKHKGDNDRAIQDYSEAVRLYRKGADQSDAMAQDGLGHMYYQGQGVPLDYAEAARWYRKAADQGLAKAQYDLGFMYYHGQGLPRDRVEADRWFHKASDQGDENALRSLGLNRTGLDEWSKIILLVIFLASLYFLIDSLLPGRSLRDWQQRATTLLGIFGMFYVGLSLYGAAHNNMRNSVYANAFNLTKWLLAEVSIIIAILWLIRRNDAGKQAGCPSLDPPLK